MAEMTGWRIGRGAARLAMLGATAGLAAYARSGWVGLRQAPPETPDTRRCGLRGFHASAGDCALFARTQQRVPTEAAHRLPLVLVHGLVVSSKVMEPLMARLGRDFRLLAPDLPGYGESSRLPRQPSVPEMADALACWLHGLGASRVQLFGLSFGCSVAAQLAARHPALVERLVLQGPGPDPRGRSLPVAVWRDFANAHREPRSSFGIARIDYAKAGLLGAAQLVRVALTARIEDVLPDVRAPTLVVTGSRDVVAPVPWCAHLAGLLPQGRLLVLPGAAHVLPYGAPDLLAEAMLPFLLEGTQATAIAA